ncbi:PIG-L family deacetylase [Eubacteriales bacterium OttesenSCG-928-G02]|nr:PIG-L family deacetylase [Eubacteriales bacterium OttesenSCG-928-G02]
MLKIMIIGAHPDDPEGVAGCTIKWIKAGHKVRFLSMTNGQSGHQTYPGYQMVKTRREESDKVAEYLGLDGYIFLSVNDGYLTTDIHNRELLMKEIREYAPDVIVTHRPWDYHPDHRCTGQLVQDCAYLVRVPNFLPTVEVPNNMPTIFYMLDTFTSPNPFRADVIFDISDVADKKIEAYSFHESQFFDWLVWIDGGDVTAVPKDKKERLNFLYEKRSKRWANMANAVRPALIAKYGQEKGSKINCCEAFEACEYGGAHTEALYKELFSPLD